MKKVTESDKESGYKKMAGIFMALDAALFAVLTLICSFVFLFAMGAYGANAYSVLLRFFVGWGIPLILFINGWGSYKKQQYQLAFWIAFLSIPFASFVIWVAVSINF